MIRTYRVEGDRCDRAEADAGIDTAASAAWIDLFEPTDDEETAVERIIGAEIPTRSEMAEIEVSSRLYTERSAAVMTAPLLVRSRGENPETTDVTFVLTQRHLVTVRYAEPSAFATFAATAGRSPQVCAGPANALAGLMDAIVDRIADVMEDIGRELDDLSLGVFSEGEDAPARDFQGQMRVLGRNAHVVSKVRESLVALSRTIGFAREIDHVREQKGAEHKLRTVARDVEVLLEHAGFLSSKTNFLLEAMLGMINIEQNAIIKIFSVVAVMFLPPTLIASIYGMNFAFMPELEWKLGYPLALAAMVVSMFVPYLYFKRKGWI